jgi:UTP--glucose-1-phosphate uridylyltransferase
MVEKPKFEDAPTKQAIIGRYVLSPRIFELLEQTKPGAGGEIQLTDGLKALLTKEKIFGYTFEGKRYDAGDKLGMLQATVEFALKRADLGPQLREYLKGLQL